MQDKPDNGLFDFSNVSRAELEALPRHALISIALSLVFTCSDADIKAALEVALKE